MDMDVIFHIRGNPCSISNKTAALCCEIADGRYDVFVITAADKSSIPSRVTSRSSAAISMSEMTRSIAVSVECFLR